MAEPGEGHRLELLPLVLEHDLLVFAARGVRRSDALHDWIRDLRLLHHLLLRRLARIDLEVVAGPPCHSDRWFFEHFRRRVRHSFKCRNHPVLRDFQHLLKLAGHFQQGREGHSPLHRK